MADVGWEALRVGGVGIRRGRGVSAGRRLQTTGEVGRVIQRISLDSGAVKYLDPSAPGQVQTRRPEVGCAKNGATAERRGQTVSSAHGRRSHLVRLRLRTSRHVGLACRTGLASGSAVHERQTSCKEACDACAYLLRPALTAPTSRPKNPRAQGRRGRRQRWRTRKRICERTITQTPESAAASYQDPGRPQPTESDPDPGQSLMHVRPCPACPELGCALPWACRASSMPRFTRQHDPRGPHRVLRGGA